MSEDTHAPLPITEAILERLITDPAEQLPAGVALGYFIISPPAIAVGAVGGYAADEIAHNVVQPVAALIDQVFGEDDVRRSADPGGDARAAPDAAAPEQVSYPDAAPDAPEQVSYPDAAPDAPEQVSYPDAAPDAPEQVSYPDAAPDGALDDDVFDGSTWDSSR